MKEIRIEADRIKLHDENGKHISTNEIIDPKMNLLQHNF